MATVVATETGSSAPALAWRPYPPGWSNALSERVEQQLGPYWWLSYLVAALLLAALYIVITQADRENGLARADLFHLVVLAGSVYFFWLIHYLDRVARNGAAFTPLFNGTSEEAAVVAYRLTTLPAHWTWSATLLGLLVALWDVAAIQRGVYWYASLLPTSPPAVVLEVVVAVLLNVGFYLFAAHTIHQLRTVNHIYTTYTRIDLFDLAPLYAFSHLAARTALGLIVIDYAWKVAGPYAYGDLLSLGSSVVLLLLALAIFLWPLLGIHRLLVKEKARALSEAGRYLRASLEEVHRRVEQRRYRRLEPVVLATSLMKEELARVEQIPTWPWREGTVRQVLSALLLPTALWFITRLLDHFVALW